MKIINRNTNLKTVMESPSGHDIIERLLYSMGLEEKIVTNTPFKYFKIGSLKKLSMGKLNDSFIDGLLRILNSLDEEDIPDHTDIQPAWWKEAVFYQVYPRSFFDSNDDGIGDIKGITMKLDYIRSLGIDAIWCSPFFDSPNADNGYDIRDYKKVMSEFGTMEDVDELIRECHKRDMKIIIDLVMNHTSDEHEWFQKALQGDPKYQAYYFMKDKPNNWTSFFGGSSWKYFDETGKYVLHTFDQKQIDLNWDNPDVRQEMYDIANYWLDKGVDGFRLDVVSFISKTEGLPDGDPLIGKLTSFTGIEHYFHGPHLDEYLREFNHQCIQPHHAYTIGECPGNGVKMSRMITGDDRDELTQLFAFDHVDNPGKIRIDLYQFDPVKMIPELVKWQTEYSNHCWPSLFFDNHDHPKMCSKIDPSGQYNKEVNKMLVTVLMTLKGTPYLYQGTEIGMTNYPFRQMDDFKDIETFNVYKELVKGGMQEEEALKKLIKGSRDHARTPMQWNNEEYAGFSKHIPWLNVNPNYTIINVESEEKEETSVLRYYKKMIRLRKENPALIYGSFEKIKSKKQLFCYYRKKGNDTFMIIVNLTNQEHPYPLKMDYQLITSNYTNYANYLRPFEANVYKV